MLAFPLIALAIGLIAVGRGTSRLFLDERPRDRRARQVMLLLGVLLLVASVAFCLF